MASDEDENEFDSEDSDEDAEVDESVPLKRLERLIETYDILKKYGCDWKKMKWGDMSMGESRQQKPPPPNDPRTHLPKIFKFAGWDAYNGPDFEYCRSQPPQYPNKLVKRLKQLHESGAGLRKEDGVEYVVTIRGEEDEQDDEEDDDEEEGGDASEGRGSDEELEKDEEDDTPGPWRYSTLEHANDRAMRELERDSSDHMNYSSNDKECEDQSFTGLHSFVEAHRESSLEYSEGVTWKIDADGCLTLRGLDRGCGWGHVVEKRRKTEIKEEQGKSKAPRKQNVKS